MWWNEQRALTLVNRIYKLQQPAIRYLVGREEQFTQLRRCAPSKCFAQCHETAVTYVVVIQIQRDEDLIWGNAHVSWDVVNIFEET